jgi:drug/metabolite transporter (DMT)-like permease
MTNDTLALVLVLGAAFLHAATNALIKSSDDPLLTRGAMSALSLAIALPFLPFVAPPPPQAWALLAPSAVVHAAYPFLLAAAYRRGDLSVAFPIARGISPLAVVALIVIFTGSVPDASQLLGVALIAAGILVLALERTSGAWRENRPAIGFACATGLVVAAYTFLDGLGLRASGSAASYIAWLIVVDGALTTTLIAAVRWRGIVQFVQRRWGHCLLATTLGLVNFTMAMYALALGAMVEIAALRETSVVFAAFLGTRFLGEGFARRRIGAAACVAAGMFSMQIFR